MGPRRVQLNIIALTLIALVLAWAHMHAEDVTITYYEKAGMCIGCPEFQVRVRGNGEATCTGVRWSGFPGQYRYHVPKSRIAEMTKALWSAGFFHIPSHTGRIVMDCGTIRLSYRDALGKHEGIDICRDSPRLTALEKRIKDLSGAVRYVKPSVQIMRNGFGPVGT